MQMLVLERRDDIVGCGDESAKTTWGNDGANRWAADATDRMIDDPASGHLSFDADGTGTTAAVLLATVKARTLLDPTDFQEFDPGETLRGRPCGVGDPGRLRGSSGLRARRKIRGRRAASRSSRPGRRQGSTTRRR